ncbi:hypothetical protein PFY12_03415 [Chryseobacterium camelliae]|uniref:TonB-dependent receptor plug domain-containing protein n=1 Tax=Chryseobacterium camelliae TaxID=1265445 RepID=A0ABY7QNF5_9FLAO|nr:hypothetical protein [Chryseobacterium camelliae]WBV61175.1 hypothetical protein PFY12_03415 [Chryseobacterium camelliae]
MKITIPTPCHENWEAMTPEEKGRFCSVCSKTVMDFTAASDEEIIDVFSNSKEEICGNFYASQLNRSLQYSSVNSVFVKFAVGFILTTGGWVSVQAQQNITQDTLKTEKLDEVILPEFGQRQTKKMSLGSPTVVSESDLMKTQQNNSKADPAKLDKKEIRIGGARSTLKEEEKPVVVLDGKIVDLKELQQTDPDSIETIHILKDASIMALYGPKAQNGVIVVTTKKKGKGKRK